MKPTFLRVWIVAFIAALVVVAAYTMYSNQQLTNQNHKISSAVVLIKNNQHQLCLNGKKSAGGIVSVANVAIHNIELRAKTLHGQQKKTTLAGLPLWRGLREKFNPQFKAQC